MPQIDGDGEVGSSIMLDDAGAGPRRGERFAANGTQTGSHRSLGEAMVDEASAVFEGELLAGRHWPSFVMSFTLGAGKGAVHSA